MKNQNSYSLATVILVSLLTGCAGNLNFAMATNNQTYDMMYKTVQMQLIIPTTDQNIFCNFHKVATTGYPKGNTKKNQYIRT